jgi:hypothetical protein
VNAGGNSGAGPGTIYWGVSLCLLPRELFLRGGRRGYGSGRRRLPRNQRGLVWGNGIAVEVGASARDWEMELVRNPREEDFRLGRAPLPDRPLSCRAVSVFFAVCASAARRTFRGFGGRSPAQQPSFFLMGRQLVTHLGLVAKPMGNYVLGRRHARGGQHTARHVSQPLPVDQSAAAVAADRRDLTRPG